MGDHCRPPLGRLSREGPYAHLREERDGFANDVRLLDQAYAEKERQLSSQPSRADGVRALDHLLVRGEMHVSMTVSKGEGDELEARMVEAFIQACLGTMDDVWPKRSKEMRAVWRMPQGDARARLDAAIAVLRQAIDD